MLTIFNFENRFASIVKENVERLLDENDLSVKSILIQDNNEQHGKESNNFLVMTSSVVDEGLAGKLIREFDWPSVGVEIPVETSRNGFESSARIEVAPAKLEKSSTDRVMFYFDRDCIERANEKLKEIFEDNGICGITVYTSYSDIDKVPERKKEWIFYRGVRL
jgi:hypothetical protein